VHLFDEIERVGRRPVGVRCGGEYRPVAAHDRVELEWGGAGFLALAGDQLQIRSGHLPWGQGPDRGVPILAVLAWLARRPGSRRYDFKALWLSLSTNIRLYHLIGFALLAVVGVFYALRTGNVGAKWPEIPWNTRSGCA